MEKNQIESMKSEFDSIMHVDDDGVEFWYARELQPLLGYSNWQNFEEVVNKAKVSCVTSGALENSHFTDVSKMVESGVAPVPKKDVMLTRYACYLIAQNGDPRKKEIAFAQGYFAVKTREAEVSLIMSWKLCIKETWLERKVRGRRLARFTNSHIMERLIA